MTEHEPAAPLDLLRRSAHVLSYGLQESEVLDRLLTQVVTAVGAWGALVRLLSPDGDRLLLAGALGLSPAQQEQDPIWIDRSEKDRRVLAGERVIAPDFPADTEPSHTDRTLAKDMGGAIGVPLQVREHIIGVLWVYVNRLDRLCHEDFQMVSILADLGALSLEKVRLHQSLYHIAAALNASLELQPALQQVLEATVQEMWLKAASIRLLDAKGQSLRLVAAYGLSGAYLSKGEIHVAESPIDQRTLHGEAVLLYDVEHEAGLEYPVEATQEGIRSVLAVPVKLDGRPLGVMRVYSAQARSFGSVAMSLLTSVAHLVALAIEKAELHAALQNRYDDLKVDLAEWYRFLALG
jgi:transcriptional regulator with GAF, ATPase, and Fis domain